MKITGSRNYVKFDLENGYVAKAEGEMLINRKFIVYKNTMKYWEPPHEKEQITLNQLENIINEVKKNTNEKTIQLIFE